MLSALMHLVALVDHTRPVLVLAQDDSGLLSFGPNRSYKVQRTTPLTLGRIPATDLTSFVARDRICTIVSTEGKVDHALRFAEDVHGAGVPLEQEFYAVNRYAIRVGNVLVRVGTPHVEEAPDTLCFVADDNVCLVVREDGLFDTALPSHRRTSYAVRNGYASLGPASTSVLRRYQVNAALEIAYPSKPQPAAKYIISAIDSHNESFARAERLAFAVSQAFQRDGVDVGQSRFTFLPNGEYGVRLDTGRVVYLHDKELEQRASAADEAALLS